MKAFGGLLVAPRGMGSYPDLAPSELRRIMREVERDMGRIHTRQSGMQLEHFVIRHKEFPGDIDKYHQVGLEMLVRYIAVTNETYEARKLQCDLAGLELDRMRLRWTHALRPARRAVREAEIENERAWREARLAFIVQDLTEYERELRVLSVLRARHRKAAIDAGQNPDDWETSERERWIHRIETDEALLRHVKETVGRSDFRTELASLTGAGERVLGGGA